MSSEKRSPVAGGADNDEGRSQSSLSLIAKTQIRTVERLREDEAKIKFVPSSAAV
jgi:hypothetical protein